MTGRSWGAGKRVLLTLYKALILSLIDYAIQAYDSASTSQKARLDVIQYKALRLCCGAMTSTATSALEVECGILPLSLRREGLNLKYAAKLIQQPSNSANNILLDAWQNHYKKPNQYEESFFQKVNPILLSLNITRIHDTVNHAGWKLVPCVIDTSLTKQINKKTNTLQTQNSVAMHYINTFTDHLCIYTDGAKSINGQTCICSVVSRISMNLVIGILDTAFLVATLF